MTLSSVEDRGWSSERIPLLPYKFWCRFKYLRRTVTSNIFHRHPSRISSATASPRPLDISPTRPPPHPPRASIHPRARVLCEVLEAPFWNYPSSQAGKMSNRHLPAGQSHPGGGHRGAPGVDMAGGGGGPRRRQHQQHHHHHQQVLQQQQQYMPQYHQQQMNPVYANYMPYSQQQYYGMGMPSPYQTGGMPSPGYGYPNYPRSPPTMQQYVPMMGVSVSPSYPRPSQQSPAVLSTPYQPPPAPMPLPPQTPSSTHSSQMIAPMTPPTPQSVDPPPPETPTSRPATQEPVTEAKTSPYRPPVSDFQPNVERTSN